MDKAAAARTVRMRAPVEVGVKVEAEVEVKVMGAAEVEEARMEATGTAARAPTPVAW